MPRRHLSDEWRTQGGVENALQGLSRDRIRREMSDLPAATAKTIDHLALRGAICPLEQLCQRFVHDPPFSSLAERTERAGHQKNPTSWHRRDPVKQPCLISSSAKEYLCRL
jgi:hypothetical protein